MICSDVILASSSSGYYSAGGFLNDAGCDVSWMQVGCPRCPALVNVPVTMAGQMVVCPTCGLSYQVPGYAPPMPPPPPQYGAPQYAAPPYMAPPYGVPHQAPQPSMEYPPLFAAPATMPPGWPQPEMMQPTAPPMPPPSAAPQPVISLTPAAQPVAAAVGLKPVTVLAPPPLPGSAKSEPTRPRWQHEKRSQPEPTRPPKAEDSPTAVLPPAASKEFHASIAAASASTPEAAKLVASPSPTAASPAPSTTKPSAKSSTKSSSANTSSANTSSNIPDSAFPKLPDGGTLAPQEPRVVGPARMDLSAVEVRLAQARRKTQTTIAVALFGLVAMTLFAWFVVNLSRPH